MSLSLELISLKFPGSKVCSVLPTWNGSRLHLRSHCRVNVYPLPTSLGSWFLARHHNLGLSLQPRLVYPNSLLLLFWTFPMAMLILCHWTLLRELQIQSNLHPESICCRPGSTLLQYRVKLFPQADHLKFLQLGSYNSQLLLSRPPVWESEVLSCSWFLALAWSTPSFLYDT